MEYKYYRDIKHNYLVAQNSEPDRAGSSYQLKLAESGRIKGLIPCDVRNINGEQFLYYDIGSMQSLKDRFSARGMNRQQQIKLFSDMKELLETLSEYLLGQESIMFDTDSIFVDLSTGAYSFMLCPCSEAGDFGKLMEQLLDITNSEDEEAALAIYELCEYTSESSALLMDGINKLLAEGSIKEEKPQPVITEKAPVYTPGYEDDEEEEDEEAEPEENGIKRANKKLGGKLQLLMAGLFAVVVGAIVYVRMDYILTSQENILSIVVMGVSLISCAVCLVGGVKELNVKVNTDLKPRKASSISNEEDEDEEDAYDNAGYEDNDYCNDYEEREMAAAAFRTPLRLTSTAREESSYNATVVLDMTEEHQGGISLYSRNLDKTVRIGLDRLPLTIGKMEGCVDRVLKDMSVSRIHCKIFKDEDSGKIAVMDLGSTNGTFKNGLKLNPREKNYIDEGDEVRIGRICFDCR
jgi:hypothetical protein